MRALHLDLPDTFVQLTGSFELQDRIPSCTACYFDLPETVIASPFRAGDHVIRFLNDQQVCVCWYLYLAADESPFVISSSGDGDEPFLDTIDFAIRAGSIDLAKKYSASLPGHSMSSSIGSGSKTASGSISICGCR